MKYKWIRGKINEKTIWWKPWGCTHTHTHTHTYIYALNKIIRKKNGITLIALVITIIVLLILSGITIQSITNKGIISNAKRAELENKRAQISETLQLRLITEQSNNPFGNSEEIISATRESVIKNIDANSFNELKQVGCSKGSLNLKNGRIKQPER